MHAVMWRLFVLVIVLAKPIASYAENWVCGQDLNLDGYTDAITETTSCRTTPQGQYCSVSSQACQTNFTCPLDANQSCVNGSCTVGGTCAAVTGSTTLSIAPAGYFTSQTTLLLTYNTSFASSGNTITVSKVALDGTPQPSFQIRASGLTFTGTVTTGAAVSGYFNYGLGIVRATGTNTITIYQALYPGSGGVCPSGFTLQPVWMANASQPAYQFDACIRSRGSLTVTGARVTTYDARGTAGAYLWNISPAYQMQGNQINVLTPNNCLSGASTCLSEGRIVFDVTAYRCSSNGQNYATNALCTASCSQTATCTTTQPTCPIDPALPCMEASAGNYRCSPNTCVDLDATPPIPTDVTSPMPQDNGTRDASGNCLDELFLFTGRPMTCGKSGVHTGFVDCCDQGGDNVIADNMGTDVGSFVTQQGISAVATIAGQAVANFAANLAAGQIASEAASNAASFATNNVINGTWFNPTTFYISAAIFIIQNYLLGQCEQIDLETAVMKESDMCHYIGTYCSDEWPLVGCVQRRETHCCFNSMLGRILHEQGRPQLASFGGWGTPEAPNCRGFTPEEFQQLDFGQIDLTEYFGVLRTEAAGVIQSNMNDAVQNFYNNVR